MGLDTLCIIGWSIAIGEGFFILYQQGRINRNEKRIEELENKFARYIKLIDEEK